LTAEHKVKTCSYIYKTRQFKEICFVNTELCLQSINYILVLQHHRMSHIQFKLYSG